MAAEKRPAQTNPQEGTIRNQAALFEIMCLLEYKAKAKRTQKAWGNVTACLM